MKSVAKFFGLWLLCISGIVAQEMVIRDASVLILGNGAVVREVRTVPPDAKQQVKMALPSGGDVHSVHIRVQGKPVAFRLQGTSLKAGFWDRIVGVPVTLLDAEGNVRYRGKFVKNPKQLPLLQLQSGEVVYISDVSRYDVQLAELPSFSEQALDTVVFQLPSRKAKVELTYQFPDLRAEVAYDARLDTANQSLDLTLLARLSNANRTVHFVNAKTALLIGEQLTRQTPGRFFAKIGSAVFTTEEAEFAPEQTFEYYRFVFPQRLDIPAGSVGVYPVYFAHKVPVKVQYIAVADYQDENRALRPAVQIRFVNNKAAGLGVPLPAGQLTLQMEAESFRIPLGKVSFPNTAVGDTVRLTVGQAFDLWGTLRLQKRESIGKRVEERTFVCVLQSAKAEETTVELRFTVPDYGDVSLLHSSVPVVARWGNVFVFHIVVPPKGEQKVTLRFRYRRP